MIGTRRILAASCLVVGGFSAAPVLAGGTPYYGFSGYYGGPATYYTHDPDVHQTTRLEDGTEAFGVRTYTAGGPFWGYTTYGRHGYVSRHRHVTRYRKVRPIRVKG